MKTHISIGTRSSPLALWQAEFIKSELLRFHPELHIDLKRINTTGDKILDSPLSKIGDKGLFTREIEHALLRRDIDLAVHSLKDLPTITTPGLCIGAITARENPHDVLIAKHNRRFDSLPKGAKIATGSLRRRSQLLAHRPDIEIVEIRGNLNTRFRKFDDSPFDAMLLAYAGVFRLGLTDRITEIFSFDTLLPAVGQGALGIEIRDDDEAISRLIAPLNDPLTERCTSAERALLRRLEGGCQIPIGALADIIDGELRLRAFVGALDGRETYRKSASTAQSDATSAETLGISLAEAFLEDGVDRLLTKIRNGVTDD